MTDLTDGQNSSPVVLDEGSDNGVQYRRHCWTTCTQALTMAYSTDDTAGLPVQCVHCPTPEASVIGSDGF